jgi:adenosylmethionine-8-amino-7-oxononanoate aminotransferase
MTVLDLEVHKEGSPENIGPQTLVELCWQKGLYVRSSTKTTVSIAPPMSITREEIDRLLNILDSAVRQLDKELK